MSKKSKDEPKITASSYINQKSVNVYDAAVLKTLYSVSELKTITEWDGEMKRLGLR